MQLLILSLDRLSACTRHHVDVTGCKSVNKQHPNIIFTRDRTFLLQIKQHGKLSFLDVLVAKKLDESLGYYRKLIHNRYLHTTSLNSKISISRLSIYREFTIYDKDSIQK